MTNTTFTKGPVLMINCSRPKHLFLLRHTVFLSLQTHPQLDVPFQTDPQNPLPDDHAAKIESLKMETFETIMARSRQGFHTRQLGSKKRSPPVVKASTVQCFQVSFSRIFWAVSTGDGITQQRLGQFQQLDPDCRTCRTQ